MKTMLEGAGKKGREADGGDEKEMRWGEQIEIDAKAGIREPWKGEGKQIGGAEQKQENNATQYGTFEQNGGIA